MQEAAANLMPLTILLAVKGRHLHTLRFLWYANKCRLPYHFLVADGAVSSTMANLLENSGSLFPHLNIEYVRYPDDVDYQAYFRKLADAASRVRTPYVMQVDNDDFLVQSGVSRCITFLAEHSEFVGISGGIGSVSLRPNRRGVLHDVVGLVEGVTFPYGHHYFPRKFESPSVAERIATDFHGTYALYYCVFRSEAFKTVSNEIVELNMSDLQLYETYLGVRAKSLGKSRIDPSTISYIRQAGTSTSARKYHQDWVNHLVHSRFTSDLDSMVGYISRFVAEQDGVREDVYAENFRQLYADKLQAQLRSSLNVSPYRSRRHPSRIAKAIVSRTVRRVRQSDMVRRAIVRRDVEALSKQLISFGSTKQYATAVVRELEEIFDVLQRDDLSEFVAKQAPDLL